MSGCEWGLTSERMRAYHDSEWGVPVRDDRGQFEHLMLEALQCGLSWSLILERREVFRACFDGFDYDKVAAYTEADVERILNTPGMLRSRRKIEAVIHNARRFQALRAEAGSFSDWLWGFTGGRTVLYEGHELGVVPARNGLSARIAAELKKRGFKYVGAVTVYAHLQACGVINDHHRDCPCWHRINAHWPTVRLPRDEEA